MNINKIPNQIRIAGAMLLLLTGWVLPAGAAESLKLHGIFRSNMVLQRDKPITIWGWAPEGKDVEVSFGTLSANGKATSDKGRWEVAFEAQPANANPQAITVKSGDDIVQIRPTLSFASRSASA